MSVRALPAWSASASSPITRILGGVAYAEVVGRPGETVLPADHCRSARREADAGSSLSSGEAEAPDERAGAGR